MTSNEFDWAQGMLCRIGTCEGLPCQFTRNIIHQLLRPKIMMDIVSLRLVLVFLAPIPTEYGRSQCHVIDTIITDSDFKISLDNYFQNVFNDSSTAKEIVAVVHEQKHFYFMQADFNTHTVWMHDSAVTKTSVSVSDATKKSAHIFVQGCAEHIKDANTLICTKARPTGQLFYNGRKPAKKNGHYTRFGWSNIRINRTSRDQT